MIIETRMQGSPKFVVATCHLDTDQDDTEPTFETIETLCRIAGDRAATMLRRHLSGYEDDGPDELELIAHG